MTELEIELNKKLLRMRQRVDILLDILTATTTEFAKLSAANNIKINQEYMNLLQESLKKLNAIAENPVNLRKALTDSLKGTN